MLVRSKRDSSEVNGITSHRERDIYIYYLEEAFIMDRSVSEKH